MERFLLLLFTFVLFGVNAYGGDRVLAYLDGKPITMSDLESYVKLLPSPKYKKMLKTEEGIRELLNYYIDRKIVLEEAKKTVPSKEASLKAHSSIDRDSAYIIAYLSREVGQKVEVKKEEIEELARKRGISKNKAYAELLSKKRREKFKELLRKLRSKHKVEFMIK